MLRHSNDPLRTNDVKTHSIMSDKHTVNAAEGDIDLEQYTQSVIASISSKASPRVRKALCVPSVQDPASPDSI